jgi:hypothetical protein
MRLAAILALVGAVAAAFAASPSRASQLIDRDATRVRWRRENGFLTRRPTGSVCYGFYRHGSLPSGMGEAYRATVSGPGVTPDVMWQARAPAHGEAPLASRAACPPRR